MQRSIVLLCFALLLSPCALAVNYHQRRELIEDASSQMTTLSADEASALKPAFHITGVRGWINDPGGMFEYNGYLHVFPQANTRSNNWAAPYWGHVASSDRVHWQRLENACSNDTSYDSNGCWTGSCFLDEAGLPSCWYTAASVQPAGYIKQQVAMLKAVNASDPLLSEWMKPSFNPLPISPPEGVSWAQFRDPHNPWEEDGEWLTAIGGAFDCAGAQLLYSTPSLSNASFTYRGLISDQVSIGQVLGTCPRAANKTADGFQCDQFGATCRVWECTDIFTLESDNITVVKWSDQDDSRAPFAIDWYVVSSVTPDFETPDFDDAAAGNSNLTEAFYENELYGQQTKPRPLDFGDIYASKSWEDAEGRRLILGWAYETAAGCVQQCSSGTNFTDSLGYQGSHHLIRVVTYNPATQTLMQHPLPEYSRLIEGNALYNGTVVLNSASPVKALNTSNWVLQSDLQAVFNVSSGSASSVPFKVGAQINFNGPSHVTAFINGTISGPNVTQAWVYIDRTNMTNTMTNATTSGQQIPLPAGGLPASAIDFRLVTDRSQLEVYAFKGLAVGTIKVYPNNTASGNWTMSLMANVSSSVSVSANVRLDHWHTCWVEDATASTPTLVNSAKSGLMSNMASLYSNTIG